jgi:hypothetical protein
MGRLLVLDIYLFQGMALVFDRPLSHIVPSIDAYRYGMGCINNVLVW